MCTGLKVTGVCVGYKVFRREVLKKIEIQKDRFGFEPEITAFEGTVKPHGFDPSTMLAGLSRPPRLSVVMPVYNEPGTIEEILLRPSRIRSRANSAARKIWQGNCTLFFLVLHAVSKPNA